MLHYVMKNIDGGGEPLELDSVLLDTSFSTLVGISGNKNWVVCITCGDWWLPWASDLFLARFRSWDVFGS
jgi:hypothetical protein